MSRTAKTTKNPVKSPEEIEFERASKEMCEKGDLAADAIFDALCVAARNLAPAFEARVEILLYGWLCVSFGRVDGGLAMVRADFEILSARLSAMRDGDFVPRMKHEISAYSISSASPTTALAQAECVMRAAQFTRALRAMFDDRVVFASDL